MAHCPLCRCLIRDDRPSVAAHGKLFHRTCLPRWNKGERFQSAAAKRRKATRRRFYADSL